MGNRPARLKFDRVERVLEDGNEWFEVILSLDGRTFVGRNQPIVDPSVARGGIRRTATAAISAVQACVEGTITCQLQEVDRVRALGKERVVILVAIDFEGRRIQLFGSCAIEDDVLAATAKAVLNATNRYVDIALYRQDR